MESGIRIYREGKPTGLVSGSATPALGLGRAHLDTAPARNGVAMSTSPWERLWNGDEDVATPFLFSSGGSINVRPIVGNSDVGVDSGMGVAMYGGLHLTTDKGDVRQRWVRIPSGIRRFLEWSGRHSGKGQCRGTLLPERKGDSCGCMLCGWWRGWR
jgi:hypothetical protein